jgi:hypothetical protein
MTDHVTVYVVVRSQAFAPLIGVYGSLEDAKRAAEAFIARIAALETTGAWGSGEGDFYYLPVTFKTEEGREKTFIDIITAQVPLTREEPALVTMQRPRLLTVPIEQCTCGVKSMFSRDHDPSCPCNIPF